MESYTEEYKLMMRKYQMLFEDPKEWDKELQKMGKPEKLDDTFNYSGIEVQEDEEL